MRSRYLFGICILFFALLLPAARAGTYALIDGGSVSGDPISYNETGLIVRQSDGNVSPRTSWEKFTQPALKQLLADAKTQKDKDFVEPFIEESLQKEAQKREVVIKKIEKPVRPTGDLGLSAAFSVPVFCFIFFVLYLANLYAAYEIAFYKNRPSLLVCGVSAVVPFIGPIIFLCIPGNIDPMEGQTLVEALAPPPPVVEEVPVHEESSVPASSPAGEISHEGDPVAHATVGASPTLHRPNLKLAHAEAEPVPAHPAPIIFHRGEFSFNRRFFETKLPGFFRIVPGEAEKDMVVVIKAVRGEFVGKRISRVTQSELYLQVFKDEASHDEMLPFAEILEVRIRHKDAA